MLGPRKSRRPPPRRRPKAPEAPPLGAAFDMTRRVIHRDPLILILDKPPGLPVHAGPRGGETLDDHLESLRFGLPERPQLAHRLDRDTSGCLVLGRNRKALRRLGALFAAGRAEKTYWAVVIGGPPEDSGRIDLPLSKLNAVRGWRMVVANNGQTAVTEWRVLGRGGGLAWIECRPLTGRTHQIRIHLAEIGCPILGDPVYGPKSGESRSKPLHLHARRILLPLDAGKPPVIAEAPLPEALQPAFSTCGWRQTTQPQHQQEDVPT